MIVAYFHIANGSLKKSDSIEELADFWGRNQGEVWVDLENPDTDELDAVGNIFHLDVDAREDCLHGDQRPRIDEFENHIFLVLYGMFRTEDEPEILPRKLAAFCGSRFLITVHSTPLRSIQETFQQCERRPGIVLKKGVASLLYRILDLVADKYGLLTGKYEDFIDNLEEQSLDLDINETILKDTAEIRRDLLEFRQMAVAQRDLLTPITEGEYEVISPTLEQRFSHVRDHYRQVIERIDLLRERIQVIRENFHAAQARRMNTIVKTLTIFSALLLPLTFLASIFGMNFQFWPPPDHWASFWGVLGVMAVLAGILLIFFRWRKWL